MLLQKGKVLYWGLMTVSFLDEIGEMTPRSGKL